MKNKLTPWFPMSTNPARPGCYLVRGTFGESLPFPYHYFNGFDWEFDADSQPFTSKGRPVGPITYAGAWRGLVVKP
ncbi:hypothetical protein J2X90_000733 [Variovorax paradoxus]|uniref:hypothetical protein n=1 Tax=Variovorax paradoxus TaxID=34073 RepID=UPI002787D904|nr:hypothetical protein [Variovorax paradoxus]MDQ0022947.1 hypothetical protein [Variovorax paradoxus]